MVSSISAQAAMRAPMLATDLGNLFENATEKVTDWGGTFITLMGAILVIVAVVIFIVGLINHGKKPIPWLLCIVMLFFGIFFFVKGWSGAEQLGQIGTSTLEELAQ